MRFVVHTPALNGDDGVLCFIDRLVDRLAEEVHLVEVPDADLLQSSSWYQKARVIRRKLLTSAMAKPPRAANDNRGPHVKVVEVLDADSARLADRLAHAPLVILVEDRESDGVFLDVVVEELGWPELQALWINSRKVTPRAMEIETAGGRDSMPQRIERAVRDAEEENRPHRLFVLCDGDAKWPGDKSEPHERSLSAVRAACVKHGVPYHILHKRCAENYIPDRAFEAWCEDPKNLNRLDRINALLRRSPVQRDHFPIKDGLTSEERAEALRVGFYGASEEEDLALLDGRLFRRSPRLFLQLTSEWRSKFTADGLRVRDGEGELDLLLHAIALEF